MKEEPIQVKFHAVFLPNHKEFNVSVKFGNKRLFEKMTIAKFLRFAREEGKQIVVDGVEIVFANEPGGTGAAETEAAVRRYLKQVADSYVEAKYKRTNLPPNSQN